METGWSGSEEVNGREQRTDCVNGCLTAVRGLMNAVCLLSGFAQLCVTRLPHTIAANYTTGSSTTPTAQHLVRQTTTHNDSANLRINRRLHVAVSVCGCVRPSD